MNFVRKLYIPYCRELVYFLIQRIIAFIYSTILFMVNLGSITGTYNNFEILQIEIYANQKACVIDT